MNFILKKILKCFKNNLKQKKVCNKNTVEIENLNIKIKELEEIICKITLPKTREKLI